MSERTRDLAPLVITLRSLKPQQRRMLLETCKSKHLKGFEEVCLNICKNSVPLTAQQLQTCRKWRKQLKLLALKKHPLKAKKKILLQKGGFLPALLPIIATVLGTVLSR